MNERCYNLAGWQVRAHLDGRLKALVVPMSPQPNVERFTPPCGHEFSVGGQDHFGYAQGTVLLGRETWGMHRDLAADYPNVGIGLIAYKAEEAYDPVDTERPDSGVYCGISHLLVDRWYSPSQMPTRYVRIRLTVTACEAVRVRDVTFDQCRALGILWSEHWDAVKSDEMRTTATEDEGWEEYMRCAFVRYWTARYGKRYPFQAAWCWYVEVTK